MRSNKSDFKQTRLTNCRILCFPDDDKQHIETECATLLWGEVVVDNERGIIRDVVFHDKIGCSESSDNQMSPSEILEDEVIDCCGHILSPGFIDLQLNGALGIDFTNSKLSLEQIQHVSSKYLPRHGVTSFCITIITSDPYVYHTLLPRIESFRNMNINDIEHNSFKWQGANMMGVHLEGPFLSQSKRGCHPSQYVVDHPSGVENVCEVYGLLNLKSMRDTIKIITIAPEIPNSPDIIKYFRDNGITVSLGHSDSSYNQALSGLKNGASMLTHLFNGMKSFHHRDPGLVGLLTLAKSQKDDMDLRPPHYGIIADGIHVHPSAVRMSYLAHKQGAVLVTDGISAMGLGDGVHSLGEVQVQIIGNRAIVLPTHDAHGGEVLAGSVTSMDKCINNYRTFTGCEMREALLAATLHPARAINVDKSKGRIRQGYDSDLVLLHDTGSNLIVLQTWAGGSCVYRNECKSKWIP